MMLCNDYLLSLLKEGREQYGFKAIRGELETEGARVEELTALKILGASAGLELTLKIGGCEAISDLRLAQNLGASCIIAPMIESPFAVLKFHEAIQRVYPTVSFRPNCYINIETTTAYQNQEAIIHVAKMAGMKGVVFGRIDFAKSQGLPRQWIENANVTDQIKQTALICHQENLDFIVGGGISQEAIPTLMALKEIHLNGFETRKVVFDLNVLSSEKLPFALEHAAFFELEWLKAKQAYYENIAHEDKARIELIEKRLKFNQESAKKVI